MAVTFKSGTNKAINAFDKDAQSVTYTLKNQPGVEFTKTPQNSNVSLDIDLVTGVSLPTGVYAVNTVSTINVYSISVKDVENNTEFMQNPTFDNGLNDWTPSSNTGSQVSQIFTDGQGDNYVQMIAGPGQYQGLAQVFSLTANRKYRVTVDAQIPIGGILRIDDRHFGRNATGAPQEGFYVDINGDGVRQTHTFEFYPTDTVTIDPFGLPDRSINGGPGSVDYGRNASTSQTDRAPNKLYYDHPVTVEATDSDGNSTEETFIIRANLPWRSISNLSMGYVGGGYKGSESWRHVCRLNYSNDTASNVGTRLSDNGVTTPNTNRSGMRYTDGSTDIWAGQGIGYSSYAFDDSSYTECFNMTTETAYNLNNQMASTRFAVQGASDYSRRMGYNHGGAEGNTSTGSSQCEKFNLTTMTRVGNIGQATSWIYHGGGMTETHMYFAQAGSATRDYYDFATETRVGNGWTLNSEFAAGASHTKAISMWDNRGWFVGWNVVVNTYVVDFGTGTMSRAGDQTTTNGEANCLTAMTTGYTCGAYNGAQNNHSDKFNFATLTVARNASGDNVGTDGASSGVAWWAET